MSFVITLLLTLIAIYAVGFIVGYAVIAPLLYKLLRRF